MNAVPREELSMESGRSNTGMIVVVLLLVAALIAVLVLWQREESEELDVDIGGGGGAALHSTPASPAAALEADVRFAEDPAIG